MPTPNKFESSTYFSFFNISFLSLEIRIIHDVMLAWDLAESLRPLLASISGVQNKKFETPKGRRINAKCQKNKYIT